MSEQISPVGDREQAIRRMVIAWLRESFETGDYRLLNRGGKTRSRDYYLQIRNRTEADLRELRVQLEIYRDGVLAETVTAKTGANGILSGEMGQLAFFTKEIYFSSLKILPETVTYRADWVPGKVMATQEKSRRLSKRKEKNSPRFQVSTADLLREKREEYLRRLGDLKENTDDGEIRAGLEQLISLIEKIFARVEEAPGTETEIKRLTDRYLPMIINSAESYQSYEKKEIDGKDMDDLKEEVISGLRLVNEACGNLLTRLYEDGIVDAATDISVLKMMLKQDGLLNPDLPKE